MRHFGNGIKKARIEAGFDTQEKFAKVCGCRQSRISKIEKMPCAPGPLRLIVKIGRAIGRTVESMVRK